jgi:hypothetical protein
VVGLLDALICEGIGTPPHGLAPEPQFRPPMKYPVKVANALEVKVPVNGVLGVSVSVSVYAPLSLFAVKVVGSVPPGTTASLTVKLTKSALAVLGVNAKPNPAIAKVNRLRVSSLPVFFICVRAPECAV